MNAGQKLFSALISFSSIMVEHGFWLGLAWPGTGVVERVHQLPSHGAIYQFHTSAQVLLILVHDQIHNILNLTLIYNRLRWLEVGERLYAVPILWKVRFACGSKNDFWLAGINSKQIYTKCIWSLRLQALPNETSEISFFHQEFSNAFIMSEGAI